MQKIVHEPRGIEEVPPEVGQACAELARRYRLPGRSERAQSIGEGAPVRGPQHAIGRLSGVRFVDELNLLLNKVMGPRAAVRRPVIALRFNRSTTREGPEQQGWKSERVLWSHVSEVGRYAWRRSEDFARRMLPSQIPTQLQFHPSLAIITLAQPPGSVDRTASADTETRI